jgi:hypothetical protein
MVLEVLCKVSLYTTNRRDLYTLLCVPRDVGIVAPVFYIVRADFYIANAWSHSGAAAVAKWHFSSVLRHLLIVGHGHSSRWSWWSACGSHCLVRADHCFWSFVTNTSRCMLITASNRSPQILLDLRQLRGCGWPLVTWTPGTVSLQFVFCLQSINDELDRVSIRSG